MDSTDSTSAKQDLVAVSALEESVQNEARGEPEAEPSGPEAQWPVAIAPCALLLIIIAALATGATKEKPLLNCDQAVLGVLLLVLWAIFSTSSSKLRPLVLFYKAIPSLLLCYFLPGILSTCHVIDPDTSGKVIADMATHYLLPTCLVLMTVSIDMPAVVKLGPKAIIMFFAATFGVMFGGPLAFLIMRLISPDTIAGDETWRGFAALAGSWIGGGANFQAMVTVFNVTDNMVSKVVIVDTFNANIWLGILLFMARHKDRVDSWLKADSSAITELSRRLESFQDSVSRVPTTNDLLLMGTVGFGSTAVATVIGNALAPALPPSMDKFGLTSAFFWVVVITTLIGFIMSFTPLRNLEGAGASKVGSLFLYVLVATIGMKMDFIEIARKPLLLLVGSFWILFHGFIMLLVAKVTKSPLFFLAVGSQANIGGAASAPVVAAAFHPALAPVGVLLAVLGYAVGTYGAMACGYMLMAVSPGHA